MSKRIPFPKTKRAVKNTALEMVIDFGRYKESPSSFELRLIATPFPQYPFY